MKKFKFSMPVIALSAAILSAFAFTPKVNFDDPLYQWQDGIVRTVAQANIAFGCSDGLSFCASGTKVSGQGPQNVNLFKP